METPSRRGSSSAAAVATLALVVAAGLFALAAWRVVAITFADRFAQSSPQRALRWIPDHPGALLARARRDLADGRVAKASATARELLAHEPLESGGFTVLALASERMGKTDRARALMRIASRRNPRDLAARGWLAEDAIARGDYNDGLAQLDAVMTLSPMHTEVLVPAIAELAADPVFAKALSVRLQEGPRWRDLLLSRLRADRGVGDGRASSPPVLPASRAVAGLHLRQRIAGVVDPRGPIPAGR